MAVAVSLGATPENDLLGADGTALQPRIEGEIELAGQSALPGGAIVTYEVQLDFNQDGVVDDILYVGEEEEYTYEFQDLRPGTVRLNMRVVATVVADDDFVEVIPGSWQEITFELTNPAPTIDVGNLDLSGQLDTPSGSNLGSSKSPVIKGSAEAVSTLLGVSTAGMTVEFDHNLDGVVDGTALVLSDGSFEYEVSNASVGDHHLRLRAVDSTSALRPLVGDWVSIHFELEPKDLPTVESFSVRYSEGLYESTLPITKTPVIEGTVNRQDFVGQLIVEFDHYYTNEEGQQRVDGIVDGSATVDVFGKYRYSPSGLAYGENKLTARVVVIAGGQRYEGNWDTTGVSFFHRSATPGVVSQLTVSDPDRAAISGRVTIDGYGQRSLAEIATVHSGTRTVRGTVWTDANGFFRYEIPELADGSYEVVARAITPDPNGVGTIAGEWTSVLELDYLTPFDPSSVTLSSWGPSIELAFDTGSVAGETADPTLRGSFEINGKVPSQLYAEIDLVVDGTLDGIADYTVPVRSDGTFEFTPPGLNSSDVVDFAVRGKLWDALNGSFVYFSAGGLNTWSASDTFTLVDTEVPTLSIDNLQVQYEIGSSSPPLTNTPLLTGTVTTTGNPAGLVVHFDENGDGVFDGSTTTRRDGSFTYRATHLKTTSPNHAIVAKVEAVDYFGTLRTSTDSYTFTLVAAPITTALAHNPSTSKVTGRIETTLPYSEVEVEYVLLGTDSDLLPVPGAPGANFDYVPASTIHRFNLAGETSPPQFTIDLTGSDAIGVLVRAVHTSTGGDATAGEWKYLRIDQAITASLAVTNFELLVPVNGSDETTTPTVTGTLGTAGAFGVVLLTTYDLDDVTPVLVSSHRVTAGSTGNFTFTPSGLSYGSTYEITAQSVYYDPNTGQEVFGTPVLTDEFTLVSQHAVVNESTFQVSSTPIGPGPMLEGEVLRADGRVAGLRVEFDWDGDEEPDGYTFTDANGHFKFTPYGLPAGTTDVRARVVEWDPVARAYTAPEFVDDTRVVTLEVILASAGPTAPEINHELLDDYGAEAQAAAALQDLLRSAVDEWLTGFDVGGAGTIDVGFGHAALLRALGADSAGDSGQFSSSVLVVDSLSLGSGDVFTLDDTESSSALATLDGGTADVTEFSYNLQLAEVSTGNFTSVVTLTLSFADYELVLDRQHLEDGSIRDVVLRLSGDYSFEFSAALNSSLGSFTIHEGANYSYWLESIVYAGENAPIVTSITSAGERQYEYYIGTQVRAPELPTATFDPWEVTAPFKDVSTTSGEIWVREDYTEQIDDGIRTGTRTSRTAEYSRYYETRTRIGSTQELLSETIVASATFTGEYADTLDYLDEFDDGKFTQGSESDSQAVVYHASLDVTTTFDSGVVESDVRSFSEEISSSFASSGSGTAGERLAGDYFEQIDLYLVPKNAAGIEITDRDLVSESWDYRLTGSRESRNTLVGTVVRNPDADYEAIDAAFTNYGAARIEGSSNTSVLFSEAVDADNKTSGRASSHFGFSSTATAREQGAGHRIGDDYLFSGQSSLDYAGSFTSSGSVVARTVSDDEALAMNLSTTTRSGAAGSASGRVAMDFVFADEGDRYSGTTSSTLAARSSIATDLHGTVTDKEYDTTVPVRDNDATTFAVAVSHVGTFEIDERPEDTPGAHPDATASGYRKNTGHVTRNEEWSNKATSYSQIADLSEFFEEEPFYVQAALAGGCVFELSSSRVSHFEDYRYTDSNGVVERQGTFADEAEHRTERSQETDYTSPDDNTTVSYREDTGSQSNSNVGGVFSDTSSPTLGSSSQANTTVDRTGKAYRATEEKYSTRDTETPGARQFDEVTTTTKSKHAGDYSGVAALENGSVTSEAGKDNANQLGRVETKGNSFRESSGSNTASGVTTTTYSATSGESTSRGEETSSGTSRGAGDRSTGEASANQSGSTRGRGTSVESKVVEGNGNRRSEVITSTATLNGRSTNTSDGKVSISPAGTDGKFDVTSSTKGNDEYRTTRTIDDSSADSRSQSTVTRTDKPNVDLSAEGIVTLVGGMTQVDTGMPTGKTGNDSTIDYTVRGNDKYGPFGAPQFYHATGKLTDEADTTLAEGDIEGVHANLVRKLTEQSTEKSGWNLTDTANNLYHGERVTRTVNGNRTTSAESFIDAEGELTGEATRDADGTFADTVEVVSWDYNFNDLSDWTKWDRRETSTLRQQEGQDSSTTGITYTNDSREQGRTTVANSDPEKPDHVTTHDNTRSEIHAQTSSSAKVSGGWEQTLSITRNVDEKRVERIENSKYALILAAESHIPYHPDTVSFSPAEEDYFIVRGELNKTKVVILVERDTYRSSHRMDETGAASDGKFSATSSSIKTTTDGVKQFVHVTGDLPPENYTYDSEERFRVVLVESQRSSEEGAYWDVRSTADALVRQQTGSGQHQAGFSTTWEHDYQQDGFDWLEPGITIGREDSHQSRHSRLTTNEFSYSPHSYQETPSEELFVNEQLDEFQRRGGSYYDYRHPTELEEFEVYTHTTASMHIVSDSRGHFVQGTGETTYHHESTHGLIHNYLAYLFPSVDYEYFHDSLEYYNYDEAYPASPQLGTVVTPMTQANSGEGGGGGSEPEEGNQQQFGKLKVPAYDGPSFKAYEDRSWLQSLYWRLKYQAPLVDDPRDSVTSHNLNPHQKIAAKAFHASGAHDLVNMAAQIAFDDKRFIKDTAVGVYNASTNLDKLPAAWEALPDHKKQDMGIQLLLGLATGSSASKLGTVDDVSRVLNKLDDAARTTTKADDFAQPLTHQNGVYEALSQQQISGAARSTHRRLANKALLEELEADPAFNRMLSEILEVDDVAAHMRSAAGRDPLNPPNTEWHHPIDNPDVLQLLRREVHRHPELQDILHPDNIGGFGTHFGN